MPEGNRSFPAVIRPGAAPPAMPSRMQQISSSLSSASSKTAAVSSPSVRSWQAAMAAALGDGAMTAAIGG